MQRYSPVFLAFGVSFLLLLNVVLPILSGAEAFRSSPFNPAVEDELGRWSNWSGDMNGNRVHDVIEAKGDAEEFEIFVHYNRRPTDSDIGRINIMGPEVRFRYQYFNTLGIVNVTKKDAFLISAFEGVVMVEHAPRVIPMLDVSSRAIMARESGEYSPNTVFDLGFTGAGVNIAIFDTGVDDSDPILRHNSVDDFDDDPDTDDPKFVAGLDATVLIVTRDGSVNPDDTDSHGTHCAGIALGTGGGTGMYRGVAPGAGLIDIKVLGGTIKSSLNVVYGAEWCVEYREQFNIRVASMSLGLTNQSDGSDMLSQAVNLMVESGIVCVVATGNSGVQFIGSPASADLAIAVGAVDDNGTVSRHDDVIASFSNYGPRLDDGDDDKLDELKPDVVAPGVNIWSAAANTPYSANIYSLMTGTSMSCPHVAGIAALMLEANPDLTPLQVRQILRDTAEPRGEPYNTSIDPVWNQYYGWGIVNAYEAVKAAIGPSPDLSVGPIYAAEQAYSGEAVTLSANILNIGEVGANNFEVSFFIGDPDSNGTQIGENQTVNFISASGTVVVSVPWTPSTCGIYNIHVVADAGNVIFEFDIQNNRGWTPIEVHLPPPDNMVAEIVGNDVRLSWSSPSPEVVKYHILRSTTPDVASFFKVAETPGTFWVDAGAVSAEKYYYIVRSVNVTNYASKNVDILGMGKLSLLEGWNIISLNLVQADTSVSKVLEPISGKYGVVQWYDSVSSAWLSSSADLKDIDHTMGLWIYMNETATLPYAGNLHIDVSISLKTGWNLVSYLGHTEKSVQIALSSLGSALENVQHHNGAGWLHYSKAKEDAGLGSTNGLSVMAPGRGYWIKVNTDCTLNYN